MRHVEYSTETVPDGALPTERPPTGRSLAAPVRAGTPLTDRSLVGRALVRSMPRGTVAAPTRIADPELLRLIRAGDRVDVVTAGSSDPYLTETTRPTAGAASPGTGYGQPQVLARSALVLAIPSASSDDSPPPTGNDGLILLAVPPWIAVELTGAGKSSQLSLILHGTRS